jgi:lyso-ornithine lipid O-acyltransferase
MQGSSPSARERPAGPLAPDAAPGGWPRGPLFAAERQGVLRPARAIRRLVLILLWTLFAAAVQSVCILLPGRPKVVFARTYWSVFCRMMGLGVQVAGQPIPGAHGGSRRPVVFVSNHSSWLDIPVLGGRLEACFISKDDVARWPLVSTIARLGRTVFISRHRTTIGQERDSMIGRMARGDNLVLFPEGTTSDGSRVLPFRSAFFAIAGGDPCPLIQPVSVVYDRLGGLPAGRACRPLFAWYGDMDIASHFWRLAQHRGLRVTVLLHPPLDPVRFANRKALAEAVWATVAEGAATLRQNRPARPIGTEAVPAVAEEARPVYA